MSDILLNMKILLIEDDLDLNAVICRQLQKHRYVTDACTDGEEGLHQALNTDAGYDLIIADRMLPIIDGLTIVKAMRQKRVNTPVILLTAMDKIGDRVEGLDSGADDYLTKPFSFEELLARIRAALRRPQEIQDIDTLEFASVCLDTSRGILSFGERQIELTKRECLLMEALMKGNSAPLSREQLILKVWGMESNIEQGNVDNYIGFLRRKLSFLRCGVAIKTQYGVGYRLEEL